MLLHRGHNDASTSTIKTIERSFFLSLRWAGAYVTPVQRTYTCLLVLYVSPSPYYKIRKHLHHWMVAVGLPYRRCLSSNIKTNAMDKKFEWRRKLARFWRLPDHKLDWVGGSHSEIYNIRGFCMTGGVGYLTWVHPLLTPQTGARRL